MPLMRKAGAPLRRQTAPMLFLPWTTLLSRRRRTATIAATTAPRSGTCLVTVISVLIRGLQRAMHPLTHRRKGAAVLSFSTEYDVQDLLHSLLRPWVADIRPEEFTPSYAGSSTRMDFLLPAHGMVIELKFVRDRSHAKNVGNELIIDIEHYRKHPDCRSLWCVIYDPQSLLTNAEGLRKDLEGRRTMADGWVDVRLFVF